MQTPSHSAVAPALGYYYQAIYALKLLFESEDSNAFVSIEALDDVYFSDGVRKELHQLKHSIKEDSKITLKHENLWKTLKVWCDYLTNNEPNNGYFILSTVSDIDKASPLNALLDLDQDRAELESNLLAEAERVIEDRKKVELKNQARRSAGEKELDLPYEKKYKGCFAFIGLPEAKRKAFLQRMLLKPGQFSIEEAIDMVKSYIKRTTQPQNHDVLAKSILAWWDREAVESLTGERHENIFQSELLEFISRKNAELFNDGFTDDLLDMALPAITNPHPVHIKQLEIIAASEVQKQRSFDTEMKARIQREIWITKSLPSAKKLKSYDQRLVKEWSYKFDETASIVDNLSEDELKAKGRALLDWTHKDAHHQVAPISNKYNNPDLIRGSFQMLSTTLQVGWHCRYKILISEPNSDEQH